MNHIEAMKQALEALEVEKTVYLRTKLPVPEYLTKAITSLRQAIAEAEKQEPVAWLYMEPNNPHLHVHYDDVDRSQFPHDEWFPVYKQPTEAKLKEKKGG